MTGAPASTSAQEPIGDVLKARTQDLHDAAEHHPFQRALFKGALPVERYAAHLAQLRYVHRALDAKLDDAVKADRRLGAIVDDDQRRSDRLEADLRELKLDPDADAPLPATAALVKEIESADALRAFGFHYVLEGSANGSRFIAMNVRKAYSFAPGFADRYLDPYGAEQPAKWKAFKQALNEQTWTGEERDTVLAAARRMFQAVAQISDELDTPRA